MPFTSGQIIRNRYHIVRPVKQGGFGAIYEAWDKNLDRTCALKENLDSSPEAFQQFEREANILASFTHLSLARVTDHFSEGGAQCLIMDFIEGDDIEAIVSQHGPIAEWQALDWIRQVCSALTHIHSQNPPVIHRDIKPSNIKITPHGQAILVDFGIAKVYRPNSKTTRGARSVTPGYSPPEQYGQGHTDARTDIYALGATLYMMLTGINPVESPTRLTGVQLTGVRIQNALVTPATEQTIMRAMALDPKYRFQTASDFAAALSATPPTILNPPIPPTVVVTPPPPSTPTTNWWALIPIPLVCILVATLALFVAAVTLNANNNATATGRAEQTEVAVRVEATNEAYAAETSLTETAEAEVRATEAEADRLATGTARSELTAVAATQTAAARPTNTPRPTATLRVSRPTATPVVNATAPVGSNCSITVTGRFARLWEKYRSTLGCPFNASEKGISDAEQRFQGGHMFWRQDTDRYYVVYDAGGASGSWAVYSRATGGNCSESPPAGYWKPTSGFGDVWCTKLGGSTSTLGWALDHEYGFVSSQGIRVQDFQFGTIFQDSDGANRNLVYVLMRTGFAREAP